MTKKTEFPRNLQKLASEYNNAIVLTWLHHVKRARNQTCFIAHEAINIVARIFALTACVAGLLYIAYIYDARPRALLMSEFTTISHHPRYEFLMEISNESRTYKLSTEGPAEVSRSS